MLQYFHPSSFDSSPKVILSSYVHFVELSRGKVDTVARETIDNVDVDWHHAMRGMKALCQLWMGVMGKFKLDCSLSESFSDESSMLTLSITRFSRSSTPF